MSGVSTRVKALTDSGSGMQNLDSNPRQRSFREVQIEDSDNSNKNRKFRVQISFHFIPPSVLVDTFYT
jgi:hypothetical protein